MHEANITWLTENVATGGDLSESRGKQQRQLRELQGMRIDMVIDCRIEDNDFDIWDRTATKYVYLPLDDYDGNVVDAAHFDAAVMAAREVLAEDGKVFIHCHMGVNRGPSTAMAILMDRGMSPEDAFDLIRSKRPIAAVSYAEDAIRAHYARRNWLPENIDKRVAKFNAHRALVFTPEEQAKTMHVVRPITGGTE